MRMGLADPVMPIITRIRRQKMPNSSSNTNFQGSQCVKEGEVVAKVLFEALVKQMDNKKARMTRQCFSETSSNAFKTKIIRR